MRFICKKIRFNQLFMIVGLFFCFFLALNYQNPLVSQKDKKSFNEKSITIIKEMPELSAEMVWLGDGNMISDTLGTKADAQICSDGQGGAIITWSDERMGSSEDDIYAQRILSNGTVLWTADGVPICTKSGPQYQPQLCSDGQGGAIITWYDDGGSDADIYAQRIKSNGIPDWTANGTTVCTASDDQDLPQICSDGQGGAIITWQDNRSGSDEIYAQRIKSNGDPVWNIDGVEICGYNYIYEPQLCSDGQGGAIITWKDKRTPYEIFAQRIRSNGTIDWSFDGVAICTSMGFQLNPQICSDGQGGAIISWKDQRDDSGDIYTQRVDSKGTTLWTYDGVAISTESGNQYGPQLCSDGQGGAIITWMVGGADDIYAQRINSVGTVQWMDNGTVICNDPTSQFSPQICSDGQGGAIIVWEDSRNTNYDIYAQRLNSDGTVYWTDNGTAISSAFNNQASPQLCSDGQGGAIIVWEDYRNSNYDIYAKRIDSDSEIPDIDEQWDDNGKAICTIINEQKETQICSDGAGGAIITWQDSRGTSDIYAQRILSNGTIFWTVDGEIISTASNNQQAPQICSDGAGGAIITWHDNRDNSQTGYDIYAQRIDPEGTVLWTANGVSICTAIFAQGEPQICTDGAGGAIITWQSANAAGWNDIYAQRINSSGDFQWMDNGTKICTYNNHQSLPQICSDGAGGAIITWDDFRPGANSDNYAQRINSQGNTLWMDNGTIISQESGNQQYCQIVSDGIGGAIITWQDWRGSDQDIYAQRILSNGTVVWTNNGVTICTASLTQQTPQICSDGIGGAIISWDDQRSGTSAVYAQRVDSDGTYQWTADGGAIFNMTEGAAYSQLCTDGVGGAIITCTVLGSDYKIHAQKINYAGGIQWMTNGEIVSTASNYRWYSQICSDGAGGAIIAWEDQRSDDGDIYSQKIIDPITDTGDNTDNGDSTDDGGDAEDGLEGDFLTILIIAVVGIIGGVAAGAFVLKKKSSQKAGRVITEKKEAVKDIKEKVVSKKEELKDQKKELARIKRETIAAQKEEQILAKRTLELELKKEKTGKIGQILDFMLNLGKELTKGDLVTGLHLSLDEADNYLKLLDASVGYKKSEKGEVKLKAEEALKQFSNPTLHDLVVKMGLDFDTAKKVGKYLTDKGFISGFTRVPTETIPVTPIKKPKKRVSTTPVSDKTSGFDLEIKRGGDWAIEGNQSVFKYKVKVKNNAKYVITNIQIVLTTIPSALEAESDRHKIDLLKPNSYQSPTFKLIAKESCVGDTIEGAVMYLDPSGNQQSITIQPFEIKYVCNLLSPKQISEEEYIKNITSMEAKEITLDCNLAPEELENELASILESNNFFLLDKTPEPAGSDFRELKGYAEGKYDHEDVGLSVNMKQVDGQTTSLVIKAMSDREEKLIDLLKDINTKCDDLKSTNELILEYSQRIELVMDQMDNLEDFLIKNLGSNFEKIKHVWSKYKAGEAGKRDLIAEGAKMIGKRFIKLFLG